MGDVTGGFPCSFLHSVCSDYKGMGTEENGLGTGLAYMQSCPAPQWRMWKEF